MVNTIKQLVVLVDENNKKIGVEEKIKAHRNGKLHRAFSVFIFNSKGELLIQQRAKTKYHSAGLWSNTVCSHPRPNERCLSAARRRLREEMGISCELKKVFCFIYNARFKNDLMENEYDCVFVGKFEGNPKPNPQEIMNYKWVSLNKLKQDIARNSKKYSVWLKIVLNGIKFQRIKRAIR